MRNKNLLLILVGFIGLLYMSNVPVQSVFDDLGSNIGNALLTLSSNHILFILGLIFTLLILLALFKE